MKGPVAVLLRPLGGSFSPGIVAGALLVVGVMCCQLAVQRAVVASYDGNIMYVVARNLVQHGTVVTTGQAYVDPFGFNTPYSVYGLGTSLLIAPAAALELAVGTRPFLLVTLVNPLIVAATAVAVQRIGVALGWGLRLATLAGAVAALATPLLWGGTELFSEPAVTLCTALVVLAAVRWRDGVAWAPLVFGGSIGAAVQFRADSILLLGIALVALPVLMPPKRLLADRRGLLLAGLPIALSLGLLGWYNVHRFGSVLLTEYGGAGFNSPFFTGLGGMLISPGKSLFVYAPVLLLGVLGMVPLLRRDPGVFAMIALLAVVRPLFYAKWDAWHGGVGWGPRFLMPLCVLLIVPAAEAVRDDRHWCRVRLWRALGVALLALGAAISALSVIMPYEQWWNVNAADASGGPAALADWIHAYYWTLSENHVAGNLRLLAGGDALPAAYWWHAGRPVGMVALAVGVLALLGALRASCRGGRPHSAIGQTPPWV